MHSPDIAKEEGKEMKDLGLCGNTCAQNSYENVNEKHPASELTVDAHDVQSIPQNRVRESQGDVT